MKYYANSPVEGLIECVSLADAEETAREIIASFREYREPGWEEQVQEVYVAVMIKTAITHADGTLAEDGEAFCLKPLDNSDVLLPGRDG
jgi:hypothetical protein